MQENVFKLSLFQEENLISERAFSADCFSPAVRISVDIRNILPSIVSMLQRGLSKKEYDTEFTILNRKEDTDNILYDFYEYRNDMIDKYPSDHRKLMKVYPEVKKQVIDDKTIKGVEFKFVFYINDNLVVERTFYVNGYNEEFRFSIDEYFLLNDISNMIYRFLKKNDVNHIWNDYDLINKYSMSIQQIRELSPSKRYELLKRIS